MRRTLVGLDLDRPLTVSTRLAYTVADKTRVADEDIAAAQRRLTEREAVPASSEPDPEPEPEPELAQPSEVSVLLA
eukprot:SAG22_NODE_595_length_8730_cov_4.200672_5_plen_76_part_00